LVFVGTPELLSVSTGAAHSNSCNDKLSDGAHPISPEENLSESEYFNVGNTSVPVPFTT